MLAPFNPTAHGWGTWSVCPCSVWPTGLVLPQFHLAAEFVWRLLRGHPLILIKLFIEQCCHYCMLNNAPIMLIVKILEFKLGDHINVFVHAFCKAMY